MKKIRKEDYFELAQFCMDYHSGQWSRGYRLLCKLGAGWNWSSELEEKLRNTEIYRYLAERHGNHI